MSCLPQYHANEILSRGSGEIPLGPEKSRKRVMETQKHFCAPCRLACKSPWDLDAHEKGPKHPKQIGEINVPKGLRPDGVRNVHEKRLYCKPCNKACPSSMNLRNHEKTKDSPSAIIGRCPCSRLGARTPLVMSLSFTSSVSLHASHHYLDLLEVAFYCL